MTLSDLGIRAAQSSLAFTFRFSSISILVVCCIFGGTTRPESISV